MQNKKQNEMIAEQGRAIAKLYTTVSGLILSWDRNGITGYNKRIELARKILKELKL